MTHPSNDMVRCKSLEIVIDETGTKVWINAEGENVGRWYNIGELMIDDRRPDESVASLHARIADLEEQILIALGERKRN